MGRVPVNQQAHKGLWEVKLLTDEGGPAGDRPAGRDRQVLTMRASVSAESRTSSETRRASVIQVQRPAEICKLRLVLLALKYSRAQVYSINLVIQDGLVHKNAFRQQGPYLQRRRRHFEPKTAPYSENKVRTSAETESLFSTVFGI